MDIDPTIGRLDRRIRVDPTCIPRKRCLY